ncbi:hypothetical protein GCM10025865_28860 [Paraoerskovia sediminicola]|uniref:Segregation and condensation protein B n=1 Tax=Paraoerskovia sediminicola TaxID=1138587 RepID=A0ABM8G612_9CELL|nr:hypothetical protein GCM10025865_28860 [Paraoerskovia sediminicola]
MVADEPILTTSLASAVALPVAEVAALLDDLAVEYRGEHGGRPRGFELRATAGGWRFYTGVPFADVVGRFVLEGQTARLTQAALETLAVIAYRQPVTRGQVSAVRGVNVDGVVRTLTTRGLVAEVGQDPDTGAIRYGTTGYFLERMGFSSLDELPALAPHLPDVGALDELGGSPTSVVGSASPAARRTRRQPRRARRHKQRQKQRRTQRQTHRRARPWTNRRRNTDEHLPAPQGIRPTRPVVGFDGRRGQQATWCAAARGQEGRARRQRRQARQAR